MTDWDIPTDDRYTHAFWLCPDHSDREAVPGSFIVSVCGELVRAGSSEDYCPACVELIERNENRVCQWCAKRG